MLSGLSFGTEYGTDFLAGIPAVPFVNDIAKWGKLIVSTGTVYTVIYCDKADILLRKHYLGIKSYFQIVTSKAGHILDDGRGYFPVLYHFNHTFEIRTVKGGAGYSIVYKEYRIGKAILLSVFT
ncbi:hypothetical protein EDD71_11265 [Fonticella tunisiensis]|uniref:Uncharacterized protein n=1 Tax=Fonticella tunisiensis TaxID=1096341 RepID=A0A4R7KNZ7_9CLOT|nr:hypothetical protein EDD71_11265 [Fonticella tunisiensis]